MSDDNKVQLVIEAADQTKSAFDSFIKSLKGLEDTAGGSTKRTGGFFDDMGSKLKENWKGLTAAAIATWAAVNKAMDWSELGAKSQQARESYRALAESMNFNPDELLKGLRKATAETIDDSALQQKALKGIAQGIDPADMEKIGEMARMAARKQGTDVLETWDRLVDSISNQTPRALRQMGFLSKEAFELINQAAREGVSDVNLLDLAITSYNLQVSKMGGVSANAAEGLQKFKAEIQDFKEVFGEKFLTVLEKAWNGVKALAAGLLAAAAAMKEARAIGLEQSADRAKAAYDAKPYGQGNKELQEWQTLQFQANQARETAERWMETARSWKNQGLRNLTGRGDLFPETEKESESKAEEGQGKSSPTKSAAEAQSDYDKALQDIRQKIWLQQEREAEAARLTLRKQNITNELNLAKEKNKLVDDENKLALERGEITEREYLKRHEALQIEDLQKTIEALNAQEKATKESFQKRIALTPEKKEPERQKLQAEQNAEISRIGGQRTTAEIQLQEQKNKGLLNELELTKRINEAKRESSLMILEAEISAERELMQLQLARGEINKEQVSERELAMQIALLEKKRENLEADLTAASSNAMKVKIEGEVEAIKKQIEVENILYEEQARRAELISTAAGAFRLGLEDLESEYGDAGQRMYDLTKTIARNMESAFSDFFFDVLTARLKSLGDYVRAFIDTIARTLANALGQEFTGFLIKGLGKIIGGGGAVPGAPPGPYEALGGVYASGRRMAFAGGGVIVPQPSWFPMANGGVGLMGEAGPEAIFPLKRDASGKLGISAEGAGKGAGGQGVAITILAVDSQSFADIVKRNPRIIVEQMSEALRSNQQIRYLFKDVLDV